MAFDQRLKAFIKIVSYFGENCRFYAHSHLSQNLRFLKMLLKQWSKFTLHACTLNKGSYHYTLFIVGQEVTGYKKCIL